MKKNYFLVLFLMTILVVSFSIGVYAGDGEKLSIGIAAPPRTMNPHGSDADSNLSIMSNMFEGLLQRTVNGELKPALATSWERMGMNTWRFELRQGVKFHNGNDFTWEDVKFTMKRLNNEEVSEFLSFGAKIESVTKVDGNPWVIDIETKDPIPFFIQNLHQIFIMDKESTEARSAGEVGTEPIGTGPYKFVEWIKGSYLKMMANENYWDEVPAIKTAELRPITEPSTRLATISSGEIDILQGVPVNFIENVTNNSKIELITRPARRSIFLCMTNDEGMPTADVRVRKAIYMAINEEEIIEKVMFGHASPAAQIPDPPTIGYSDKIERLPYNPERAKELMAEAGYADGFKITLSGPNDRYVQDEQILSAVASYLSKVGIECEVDAKPKSIFFEEVSNQELDFYLIGWFDGSYDFGRSFSKLVHSIDRENGYGSLNGTRYSAPVLDDLFATTSRIIDPDIRGDVLRVINRLAMSPEKVAVIPLHYQEDTYAVFKDRGINFTPRSDTWIVFKEMSIK